MGLSSRVNGRNKSEDAGESNRYVLLHSFFFLLWYNIHTTFYFNYLNMQFSDIK